MNQNQYVSDIIALGFIKSIKDISVDNSDLSNPKYVSNLLCDFIDFEKVINHFSLSYLSNIDTLIWNNVLYLIEFKHKNNPNQLPSSKDIRLKFYESLTCIVKSYNLLLLQPQTYNDLFVCCSQIVYLVVTNSNFSVGDTSRMQNVFASYKEMNPSIKNLTFKYIKGIDFDTQFRAFDVTTQS